jgi:hypothetical protein
MQPASNLKDGKGMIPTPGTRVQLSTISLPCAKLTLTAHKLNQDEIVYGGPTVVAALGASAAASTRSGTPLVPGQSVDIYIDNLTKVWLDGIVANDAYSFTYLL